MQSAAIFKGALPQRQIISDFVASLPAYIRCTSDFEQGLKKPTLKVNALKHNYIQFNETNCIQWLVFDIDNGWESVMAWHDNDQPEPNFIIQNPKSGNCHFFYKLACPVYLKVSDDSKVSDKAESYLDAIRTAMTSALKADANFTHQITKNPLSEKWRVIECHNSAFELSELAGNLTLKSKFQTFQIKKQFAKNDARFIAVGRNCTLFDDLRAYAYQAVKAFKNKSTFESFHAELLSYARDLNNRFSTELPLKEVMHTVKSVARWVWDKFTRTGETCKRGVMGFAESKRLNPELERLSSEEIKARQAAAAVRTNVIKKANTEEKIKTAIAGLITAKEAVNNSAIARQAGLCRRAVVAFSKAVGGCAFRWYQVVTPSNASLESLFNFAKQVNAALSGWVEVTLSKLGDFRGLIVREVLVMPSAVWHVLPHFPQLESP